MVWDLVNLNSNNCCPHMITLPGILGNKTRLRSFTSALGK